MTPIEKTRQQVSHHRVVNQYLIILKSFMIQDLSVFHAVRLEEKYHTSNYVLYFQYARHLLRLFNVASGISSRNAIVQRRKRFGNAWQ